MVSIELVIFIVLIIFLLYMSFKSYGSGGTYDMSGFINIFWIIVTIAFVLIWGGVFWW